VNGALAVAIHDVEPRSYERSKEIRQWLLEREVLRVTLLVIPAAELHPLGPRAPRLTAWLRGRVAAGDAIAQHGLAHKATAPTRWPRSALTRWQGGPAAEFPGLGPGEAARRVEVGRRLLRDVELEPRGFVAPGYAYTRALRSVLAGSFDWFADLRSVRTGSGGRIPAHALCLGNSTPLKRSLSPLIVRAAARAGGGRLLRVDVHPADFELPSHLATLESLLELGRGRDAITYDDLAA
jgi:predicted deacetylase